jgi:tyrosine-protein phosphatase YwqE
MLVTDAHASRRRRPVLSEGLTQLKEIVGEKAAMEMVKTIPEKILNGEDIDMEFPIPLEKKSIWKINSFISKVLRKHPVNSLTR